ncbi:hypothetical protein OGAPHI_002886 [Ogataea philodendri]|uniref:SET domain-containing protein n=1 Tax=Ogataea philodendri TaxID=1378263 RepID=A0A9P8P8I2_9ASCO|nr:uncharacterized protein OGAPHI_002886 [Ogataea philodendri]KAH3667237.1 hypothetical protein OGAPHI_002886 [Ogataea philodendri]
MEDRQDTFNTGLDELIKWSVSKGAKFNGVEFTFGDQRGIYGKLAGKKSLHDPLISIPKAIFFTPDLAASYFKTRVSKNEYSFLLLAKLKFDPEDTILDGVNLTAKFRPYLNILPGIGHEIGVPYFWSQKEQELLRGTDAFIILNRRHEQVYNDWQRTTSALFPLDKLGSKFDSPDPTKEIKDWKSFHAYLWAYSIYLSRAFPYFMVDKKETDLNKGFLLPIVDLLNHENGHTVKWGFEDDHFEFYSLDKTLSQGDEIFNNYGDKANIDLLLTYGFVLDKNPHDTTSITLKVPESTILDARNYGITLPENSSTEGINFEISVDNSLPHCLVQFFAFLYKLSSENEGFTLRTYLEGIAQLRQILSSRCESFKSWKIADSSDISQQTIKTVKIYRNNQRSLFQTAVEKCDKIEKELIQTHKPLTFTKALNFDKVFQNSLIVLFGTADTSDLIKRDLLEQTLLLFIMRCSNTPLQKDSPLNFIAEAFDDVKSTIEITRDDVLEYRDLYRSLFPALTQKVPEIYGKGDYSAKSMIIAGTSLGISNQLGEEVAKNLAMDVEYRIHEILEQALKFMRHGKRRTLTVQDIDRAMKILNLEPLYGYDVSRPLVFKEAMVGPGQTLYYVDDDDIEFEKIINQSLPRVPRFTSFTAHWLAIEGVQPTISQNPNPNEIRQLPPNQRGSMDNMLSLNNDDISLTTDLSTGLTSVDTGSQGRKKDLDVKPLVKHMLSKELQLYFDKAVGALLDDSNESLRAAALESLESDPGLHQLVPYFIQFVAETITHNVKNTSVLTTMLMVIYSLLSNKSIFLDPYIHALMPCILTLLLGKKIGLVQNDVEENKEHFNIRELAASLLQRIIRDYGSSYTTLKPRVTRTLLRAFLSNTTKNSIGTQFGAMKGLKFLGPEVVRIIMVGNLKSWSASVLEDYPKDSREFQILTESVIDCLSSLNPDKSQDQSQSSNNKTLNSTQSLEDHEIEKLSQRIGSPGLTGDTNAIGTSKLDDDEAALVIFAPWIRISFEQQLGDVSCGKAVFDRVSFSSLTVGSTLNWDFVGVNSSVSFANSVSLPKGVVILRFPVGVPEFIIVIGKFFDFFTGVASISV